MLVTDNLIPSRICIKRDNGGWANEHKLTPELLRRVSVEGVALYWKIDKGALWILDIGVMGQYFVRTIYNRNQDHKVFHSVEKTEIESFCKENKIFGY